MTYLIRCTDGENIGKFVYTANHLNTRDMFRYVAKIRDAMYYDKITAKKIINDRGAINHEMVNLFDLAKEMEETND